MNTESENVSLRSVPPVTTEGMDTLVTSAVTGPRTIADKDLAVKLDGHSLEAIVELKISRFLEHIGNYYPDNMHDMIMKTVERPLIKQILLRTGGNQVQAARILGIKRNTLLKKMKMF